MPSISLLIPAYHERLTIEPLMERALAVLQSCTDDYELIVLDDASTDDTFAIMQRVQARHPGIIVRRHERNMGIAATFEELYQLASKEFVFLISGDGQFPPETLTRCLPLLAEHDIVICRRVSKHYTPYRHAVSWAYRWLPRLLFGVDLVDPGSVKVVRRTIYREVPVTSTSVFVEAERIIRAVRRGYRLTAVDMESQPRVGGQASGARLPVALAAARDLMRFWLSGGR
ncbi:MAG: glycosyltransferase family 2 protein [Acidobacteria bacterium]|nr:glycosyltransferase family 2 protein [Acidobacteriota bacterium]MBP8274802.1 glycosyltransferase family 2 protein [Acidobacteriota bacterium]